jgi:hypothetical protein
MVCSALAALFLFLGLSVIHSRSAPQADFVRFSKPDLLTFDELVELEKNDTPSAALAAKLEHLLTTPFLSNEAYLDGAKLKRPSSPELGPFLRAVCWNIERGIHFDPIRIALSESEKFDQVLAEKKDPKAKPLSPDQLKIVKQQLDILQPTDLLILNEVDYGVTRTDYRDVARDLAKALNMNYAYGVEFLEVEVRRGVAEREGRDRARPQDLVHQPELDLAEALAAEVRRQVRGPQSAALDLLLQRRVDAVERRLIEVGDDRLDRPDLLAHEGAHDALHLSGVLLDLLHAGGEAVLRLERSDQQADRKREDR